MKNLTARIKPDWAQRVWHDTVATVDDFLISEIARNTQDIEDELSRPTKAEVGAYIVNASLMSNQLPCIALKHFDEGDIAKGWERMLESLSFLLLSFKCHFAIKFPNGTRLDSNMGSLLQCTALALTSPGIAEWTSKFILDIERNPKSKLHAKDPNDFQILCNLFASETLGAKAKPAWLEQLDAGLYGPLLRASNFEEAQAALNELAINRFTLCDDIILPYPPFDSITFTHFPIDMIAILKMRHPELGNLHFGCMESPLCHPPAELNWVKPNLVQRVEARMRQIHNYPEVDWI